MSAGMNHPVAESLVCKDLSKLAPKFRMAVEGALSDCHIVGLDAIVYESTRSDELQRLYYARGRTEIPPDYTVTNAPDAEHGWHFFGLAVDVISKSKEWSAGDIWNRKVRGLFVARGLAAGMDWPHPDVPHYQWGNCRRSPSDEARNLYHTGYEECVGSDEEKHAAGLIAVWDAVGANN